MSTSKPAAVGKTSGSAIDPIAARKYITNDDVSVRMFGNALLEKFSHVHPAVPHVIYIPVIVFALFLAGQRGLGATAIAGVFLAGVAAWTLAEYAIHRFAFHVPDELEERTLAAVRRVPDGEPVMAALTLGEQAFFLMHGVHHFFPNDSRRLVMPPSVSTPLAVGFYGLFAVTLGAELAPAFFAGFVTGYLLYDTTHYVVHHQRCGGRWSSYVKKLHMRHHYVNPDRDYGVSSPLWDFVLRTAGRPSKRGA